MHLKKPTQKGKKWVQEGCLMGACGHVGSLAHLLREEHIAPFSLPGFETKVLKRHPKVDTFDLSLSALTRNPHAHMKAKAPTLH